MRLRDIFSKQPKPVKFVIDPLWVNYYDEQDNQFHRRLVNIDVARFDKLWANTNSNFYIGKGGMGQIKNRYQKFGEFSSTTNQPIHASTVDVMC